MTEYTIDDGMLAQWRVGCVRAMAPFNPEGSCAGCEYRNRDLDDKCEFDDDEMQKIFQSNPVKKRSSSALDQALNEGDGVYRP